MGRSCCSAARVCGRFRTLPVAANKTRAASRDMGERIPVTALRRNAEPPTYQLFERSAVAGARRLQLATNGNPVRHAVHLPGAQVNVVPHFGKGKPDEPNSCTISSLTRGASLNIRRLSL